MAAINKWFVTGDTHGRVLDRLNNISTTPEETAVIILGDAGINFYLNKTDKKNKKILNTRGFQIYAVRGNHEERPENLNYPQVYDENVQGYVYQELDFPNIHYFLDGGEYNINGYSILTIGGAYSVDKWYRVSHFANDATWTGWFKDEQLTAEEMNSIFQKVNGKTYDFIFTHTCPIGWEPTELFLTGIDQSKVDKTMELWMEELKNNISWNYAWCFGHYHGDMLMRPHVEMYFHDIEALDVIANRWKDPKNLDWWLIKSRDYYME